MSSGLKAWRDQKREKGVSTWEKEQSPEPWTALRTEQPKRGKTLKGVVLQHEKEITRNR